MVRLVSVPQRAVERASTTLQEGIDGTAKLLEELNETRSGITMAIARLLGMDNVPQTRRMACAIIANALVFHERIAGMHPEVNPLAKVCGDVVDNPQGEVLAAWAKILDINYWAIFAIAKDILEQLPSGDAANILRRLRHTAQAVNATGVDNAHDLTGRIFQRLIADRKYLATFYTLPRLPRSWPGWPSPRWKGWIGPAPRPSGAYALAISPAGQVRCSLRCTSRLPRATSGPAVTRRSCTQ